MPLRMLSAAFILFFARASPVAGAPPGLKDAHPTKGALLASDSSGAVAVLELQARRLTLYRAGRRTSVCDAVSMDSWSPSLQAGVQAMAVASDLLLLASGISQGSRLSVIDLATCRIVASRDLAEGELVRHAAGSEAGWAVVARKPTGPPRAVLMDPLLKPVGETTAYEGPRLSKNAGAADVLPVLDGSRLWLLPKARYGLVEWKATEQRWSSTAAPSCLAANGIDVSGAENLWWLERMLDLTDEAGKPMVEALIRAASEGTGGTGFVGAVAAAATDGERIAVLVRENRGRSCRLDLWETENLQPMSATRLEGVCSGFLALTERHAWVFGSTGFRDIPLPGGRRSSTPLCQEKTSAPP